MLSDRSRSCSACIRCEDLGCKCESRNDNGPCAQCLLGGHECLTNITNTLKYGTSLERDDLLDIIREQQTQIESLRVQLKAHTRGEQQPPIKVEMGGLDEPSASNAYDWDMLTLSDGTGEWPPFPSALNGNYSLGLRKSASELLPLESDDDSLRLGVRFHSATMDSGTMENGTAKAKRMARACARCRELKTKCTSTSDTGPCQRCLNSGRECTIPAQNTPRAPSKRERLLERIRGQSREIDRLMKQLEMTGTHDGRALAAASDLLASSVLVPKSDVDTKVEWEQGQLS
ncbi:hypothetical protein FPV67DRAFT_791011 [Lyophyllum atratum]|nr:hypothetical protein FPV67DRAFT_791011 [Lyophyllum atratum]